MGEVVFIHDNNVVIQTINNQTGIGLANRVHSEIQFRKINTYLILNTIIKRNIIDLGAWIGDNSIPWAKLNSGTVYAIDPSSFNCLFIDTICQINEIENVITIVGAISDTEEILSTLEDLQHCSFVYNNPIPYFFSENKIKATTLDILYETKVVEDIGYIHLDVEGMEYKVMKGASTLIDKERPIITFEQHVDRDNVKECISFLNEKMYTVFMIDELLSGCAQDCRNFIAFPNELYSEKLKDNINNHIGYSILISY